MPFVGPSPVSRHAQASRAALAIATLLMLALAFLAGAGRTGIITTLASALAYGTVAMLMLGGLRAHEPHQRFGAANTVTLLRGAIASLLLGMAIEGILSHEGLGARWMDARGVWGWIPAASAMVFLLLDGVDGWLARRLGLTSPFGARFDMEVDAFAILALAFLAVAGGRAGPWVLAIGLLRYLFVAAGWIWPALRQSLPPSLRRQTICVLTTAVLIYALAPMPPSPFIGILLGSGLVALVLSFGVDAAWLLTRARAAAERKRARLATSREQTG